MQSICIESALHHVQRTVRWRSSLVPLFVLATLLLIPAVFHAQIAGTANIQGTVTDATGAVVGKASVALTDEATQVKRTTVSDDSGVYLFPALPIGTYDLTSHRSRLQDLRAEGHRARGGQQHQRSMRASPWEPRSRRSKSRPKVSRCRLRTPLSSRQSTNTAIDRNAAQRPADDGADYGFGRVQHSSWRRLYRQQILLSDHFGFHRRRRRQHDAMATRWRRQPGLHGQRQPALSLPRCGQRVQRGIDGSRRAGWWPRGWPGQRRHQVGNEPVPRRGLRVHPQQLPRRHQLLLYDARHAAPESVRRHVWRPHQAQQDVRLRGLPAHQGRSVAGELRRPPCPRQPT